MILIEDGSGSLFRDFHIVLPHGKPGGKIRQNHVDEELRLLGPPRASLLLDDFS